MSTKGTMHHASGVNHIQPATLTSIAPLEELRMVGSREPRTQLEEQALFLAAAVRSLTSRCTSSDGFTKIRREIAVQEPASRAGSLTQVSIGFINALGHILRTDGELHTLLKGISAPGYFQEYVGKQLIFGIPTKEAAQLDELFDYSLASGDFGPQTSIIAATEGLLSELRTLVSPLLRQVADVPPTPGPFSRDTRLVHAAIALVGALKFSIFEAYPEYQQHDLRELRDVYIARLWRSFTTICARELLDIVGDRRKLQGAIDQIKNRKFYLTDMDQKLRQFVGTFESLRVVAAGLDMGLASVSTAGAIQHVGAALSALVVERVSSSGTPIEYYGTLPVGSVVIEFGGNSTGRFLGVFSGGDGTFRIGYSPAQTDRGYGSLVWQESLSAVNYNIISQVAGFVRSETGQWAPMSWSEFHCPFRPGELSPELMDSLELARTSMGFLLERIWNWVPHLFSAQPGIGCLAFRLLPDKGGIVSVPMSDAQRVELQKLLPMAGAAPTSLTLPEESTVAAPESLANLLHHRGIYWPDVARTLSHNFGVRFSTQGKGSHSTLQRDGYPGWTVSQRVRESTTPMTYSYLRRLLNQLGIREYDFADTL